MGQLLNFPKFFRLSGSDYCDSEPVNLENGQSCYMCWRNESVGVLVKSVCLMNLGDLFPMRVTLVDDKVFDIDNILPDVASDVFEVDESCKSQCWGNFDMVLALQESNSVSGNYFPNLVDEGDWKYIREFALNFESKFFINTNYIHMGLTQFSLDSRKTINLYPHISHDSNVIEKVTNGLTKEYCSQRADLWEDQNECRNGNNIAKGLLDSLDILTKSGIDRYHRISLGKVIVLVINNEGNGIPFEWDSRTWTSMDQVLQYTERSGAFIVAVGVGDKVSEEYLKTISSFDLNGENLILHVDSYEELASDDIVEQLSNEVCRLFSTSTTDCRDCQGLCSCGRCLCPDSCESDKCSSGKCSEVYNHFGGCVFTSLHCDIQSSDDLCKVYSCDPIDGCISTDIICEDNNLCTEDFCSSEFGCMYIPKECDTEDKVCNMSICNPLNGKCEAMINCDDENECTKDYCTPTGCLNVNISHLCNDQNPCTSSTCDPSSGCIYSPKECSSCEDIICEQNDDKCLSNECNTAFGECIIFEKSCDDLNECTVDTCESDIGCVHEPLDCTLDGDLCNIGYCDPEMGCLKKPKCERVSLCADQICEENTGECYEIEDDCDDNDLCTADYCNGEVGCVHIPNVFCNDGNACTIDTCNNATGLCEYVPITTQYCESQFPEMTKCQLAYCDEVYGCLLQDITCDASEKECEYSICSNDHCLFDDLEICLHSIHTPYPKGIIVMIVVSSIMVLVIGVVCLIRIINWYRVMKTDFSADLKKPLYRPTYFNSNSIDE
eukprot:TRINITY_DN7428_c0_g1_i1.p1 TRINITY_DN7428_c0_g1~~TRINITY_DN7428_c0_g1_i1.p1  ORF type:complete len:870 (-),score=165.81 TRINITY_DN7428_c0_g1_i1:20-2356(-)